ncbi:MAG: hypothetical protein KF809_04725 [Chloroflexi bacterium]|nr:hypothetical protein [Chloroflexota bacterium]
MSESSVTLPDLVRDGVLDADLAALVWLLVEGGSPVIVTGLAPSSDRETVARAVLGLPPATPGTVLDADRAPLTVAALAASMRDGERLAVMVEAPDLRTALTRLTGDAHELPEDAVRRLGLVLVLERVPLVARPGPIGDGLRVRAAHYLRPAERDPQGHVQRRPPAVLATWRTEEDTFDDFSWGVAPELADRVDRSQADLEEAIARRALALRRLVAGQPGPATLEEVLAAEPPRVAAPAHPVATPSPVHSPLTDPQPHDHDRGTPPVH